MTGITEAENLILRLTNPRATGHKLSKEDELIELLQTDVAACAHCLRMLAHKVQSPSEREALAGLLLLLVLRERGGRSVQAELGKHGYLNELIKVLTAKCGGEKSPQSVKEKTTEMLFSWSQTFCCERENAEAYGALKRKGLVKDHPVAVLQPSAQPQAPTAKNAVVGDEKEPPLQRRSLPRIDPSDMVAGNRRIESMVREDDHGKEEMIYRHSDLIQLKEDAQLLLDLETQYSYSPDTSIVPERKFMRRLFDGCEEHEARVHKQAVDIVLSNSNVKDAPNFADLLATSDELARVTRKYHLLGLAEEKFGPSKKHHSKQPSGSRAAAKELHNADYTHTSCSGPPVVGQVGTSATLHHLVVDYLRRYDWDLAERFDELPIAAGSEKTALAKIIRLVSLNSPSTGTGGSFCFADSGRKAESSHVRKSCRNDQRLKLRQEQERLRCRILAGEEDPRLEVVDVEGKGRGLLAREAFQKGEFVVEYSGVLRSYTDAKVKEAFYAQFPDLYGCYMYLFQYGQASLCIDATEDDGRYGRLLNHSKRRANLKPEVMAINGQPHVILRARMDIPAGAELLYDYGDHSSSNIANCPWLKD